MSFYDSPVKPRQLPRWWVRFSETYPLFPNAIAIAGLVWICFLLAPIIDGAEKHGHSEVVETISMLSGSQTVVDKANSLREVYHSWFPEEVRNFISLLYSNLALYLVVPFLLLLECLFPCKPSQPLIGKGLLQDSIWYIVLLSLQVLIFFPLSHFFQEYLSFATIGAAATWPVYVQITAAILVAEFLIWCNHFIRHKIHTLWLFHAIHHSQEELNVFTDDRGHFIDELVGSLFTFVPFFIFQVSDIYAITVIGIYMPIHNRFVHANIKMNLGWLGWIFTSPQFHRVHHSREPEHLDKNFGVHLSIFDHLFGTACKNRNVYPATGIDDPRFPREQNIRLRQLPGNMIKQTIYPFLQIFEKLQASRPVNFFRTRFFSRRSGNIKS